MLNKLGFKLLQERDILASIVTANVTDYCNPTPPDISNVKIFDPPPQEPKTQIIEEKLKDSDDEELLSMTRDDESSTDDEIATQKEQEELINKQVKESENDKMEAESTTIPPTVAYIPTPPELGQKKPQNNSESQAPKVDKENLSQDSQSKKRPRESSLVLENPPPKAKKNEQHTSSVKIKQEPVDSQEQEKKRKKIIFPEHENKPTTFIPTVVKPIKERERETVKVKQLQESDDEDDQ